VVVRAGAATLKNKTVEAVIDHITQALPEPRGGYCVLFAQSYLKALSALFEHKANVERLKATTWLNVATFCLHGINQYLDENDTEPSGLSRSMSGLGSSYYSGSLAKSSLANGHSQRKSSGVSKQNVEDLLHVVFSLVSASNAPLLGKVDDIAACIIRLLHLQGSAVSAVHHLAFSILNNVLCFCREDRIFLLQSVGKEAIAIVSRFWQGKITSRDEMMNSVKDEMLILLIIIHLHLERSILDEESDDLALRLESLLDIMRAEYIRRLDRDPLLLDDLEMTDLGTTIPDRTPFRLQIFRLRTHNFGAERNWANLQIIGILERLLKLSGQQKSLVLAEDADQHPRKRQRTAQHSDRFLDPIRSEDPNVRLAGLQVLPFVLEDYQLSSDDLAILLGYLSTCASEKMGLIASWALLAIAR